MNDRNYLLSGASVGGPGTHTYFYQYFPTEELALAAVTTSRLEGKRVNAVLVKFQDAFDTVGTAIRAFGDDEMYWGTYYTPEMFDT